MKNVTVVQDEKRGLLALVGLNTTSRDILVAFRGSTVLPSWLVDFEFWAATQSYPGCPTCRVHRGFYEGYHTVLAPAIARPLRQLIHAHGDSRVVVMGHSLGAALAVHHALDLLANYTLPRGEGGAPALHVYTMGNPKMGNGPFVSLFEDRMPAGQRWRVVNQRDIVPHIPPATWLLNYSQWGPEVWYQHTSDPTPKLCQGGDDPTCSASLPFYNWTPLDHCPYFGVSICKCKA